MADRGEAPGPSSQDKGKAKLGEPSYFTSAHVQSDRNEPGPDSGSLAREDMCLLIALTSQEVDGSGLHLGADEAFLLTNRAETVGNPSGRFSEDLDMTDVFDNRYRMKLSNHNTGSLRQFLLNRDWSRFVYMNKLKAGDELWFFRLLDPVSKNTCYALRHFKNLNSHFSDDNQSTRSLPCPEPSRASPSVAPADVAPSIERLHPDLSKTLTSQDVDPTNPKLYIDASEAYTLTDSVELLKPNPNPSQMMLSVFDEVDRPYHMQLSHLSIRRFTISADWGRFVRDHKLKAGDQVLFYRYPTSDGLDPYYELKFVSKKETEIYQPSPDSRGITDTSCNLTKTLFAHHENMFRLYFDATEAWHLTHNDRVLRHWPIMKNLLVYDESDMPYDMMLMHMKRDGEVSYTLGSGWHRFVSSHGLKAGDKVNIYRIQGETKYKVRYTRAGLPSGVGPSGSGGRKEAEQG
ncbi:hypothetical protein CASFOL_039724 [Castilleja foliolosa]|uniref:TF-B3 domain-containing protein n=1 Tax=Castilleja foliolosa TaxID=1961234 RepID=A0ABD3BGC3_9LAMI